MASSHPTEVSEPSAVVVVYDEQTGAVQHVHQEFIEPGAHSVVEDDILKRA